MKKHDEHNGSKLIRSLLIYSEHPLLLLKLFAKKLPQTFLVVLAIESLILALHVLLCKSPLFQLDAACLAVSPPLLTLQLVQHTLLLSLLTTHLALVSDLHEHRPQLLSLLLEDVHCCKEFRVQLTLLA